MPREQDNKMIFALYSYHRVSQREGLLSGLTILLLLIGLLLSSHSVMARDVRFHVQGVSGDLQDNVQNYLAAMPSFRADRLAYRHTQILDAITKGMQSMGYYSAKIELSQEKPGSDRVLVKITPGKPVIIRSFRLSLQGDALNDKAFDRLIKRLPLKEGSVFHHGKYEEIKSALKNRALARGYFDAEMVVSKVKIYPKENVADVNIEFSTGHRYKFGDVQIDGVAQSEKLIRPLVPFKSGDPYTATKLAEFSQALSETKYFREVDVHPLLKSAKNYTVPIYVELKPKSNNLVEVGMGYDTDEGVRAQLGWEKPWLNEYGHSMSAQLKVSMVQQDITLNYRIPGKDPINDYYNLQAVYENTELNDTQSKLSNVGIHYWTKKLGDWQRDYFTRLEYEDYVQGSETGNTLLLIPGISLNRLRVDKNVDPESGDRILITTEFSEPEWGSDLGFVRLWGRTKWLRTPWDGARFIWRFEQGAIINEPIDNMPASLRFFAGGDQSIRGYGYQTISPVDASGQLTGARYLTTGSIEYGHPVAEKWRLATFVDAGTATNDYLDPIKVGTGLGIRWLSPLGPIRFDLAFGVSEVQIPWRLHFGLGAEL